LAVTAVTGRLLPSPIVGADYYWLLLLCAAILLPVGVALRRLTLHPREQVHVPAPLMLLLKR
jgi:hypothetical protein